MKGKRRSKTNMIGVAAFIFFSAVSISAQKSGKPEMAPSVDPIRSSPAFAEVLLRETEIEAELESLLVEYTDEFPRVKELRYTFDLLEKEKTRLLLIKPEESQKLTLALGKLMVKKVDAATDLWRAKQGYADEHPEVKRAKRKLEIYDKAIKEILG